MTAEIEPYLDMWLALARVLRERPARCTRPRDRRRDRRCDDLSYVLS
jgi:hypothetical protein